MRRYVPAVVLVAALACQPATPPPAAAPSPPSCSKSQLVDVRVDVDPALPPADDPLSEPRRSALERLRSDAACSDTVALVVVHRGHTVLDVRAAGVEDRPYPLYSITKLFDAMVVGMLVADGRVSLSDPLSWFYPDWGIGPKARVTVEHILRHTSGLPHIASAKMIDEASDPLKLARWIPLDHEPGSRFAYSNEGVELLVDVVRIASGKPLDRFVRERVLEPLDIDRYAWNRDPEHRPYAFGGLQLRAHDLARVGVMLCQGGTWAGKRVLPRGWLEKMTAPGPANPGYGLLTSLFRDDGGRVVGFGHLGTGYQYLFVAPRSQLVVVRFRGRRDDDPVRFEDDLLRLATAFERGAG